MIRNRITPGDCRRALSLRLGAALLFTSAAWLVLGSAAARAWEAPECSASTGAPGASRGEALSSTLEILSWNIQKAGNTGWADDLTALAGDIDLAFIQEASLQANIPAAIGGSLHQAFAAGYTTSELDTGVMTLSSSSPSQDCAFTSLEPWLGTPKATSVTTFPLVGRPDTLLAINLHAVNFSLGVEEFRQQFKALDALLAGHQGPVILAGDLNTWSGERQLVVDDFTRKYGLDAVAFKPDLRSTVFGRALDHIYVRGMEPLSARVIPVSTSDHNPLRVSLALQ